MPGKNFQIYVLKCLDIDGDHRIKIIFRVTAHTCAHPIHAIQAPARTIAGSRIHLHLWSRKDSRDPAAVPVHPSSLGRDGLGSPSRRAPAPQRSISGFPENMIDQKHSWSLWVWGMRLFVWVSVWVGMCVCVYIYIYMCVYVYTYTYTWNHAQGCKSACIELKTRWRVARSVEDKVRSVHMKIFYRETLL